MRIIEYTDDIDWYVNLRDNNDAIILPILCDDNIHYSLNALSFIYVYFIQSDDECIIPIKHNDCISTPLGADMYFNNNRKYYIINSRLSAYFKGYAFYDIELIYWLNSGDTLPYDTLTSYKNIYKLWYSKVRNLNTIIPIMKHAEYCFSVVQCVIEYIQNFNLTAAYEIYQNLIIPNLTAIETAGLHISSPGKFISKNAIHNNMVYTYYNIYTRTGRPSNTFAGINYAALDKTSGIRGIFNSRFDGGKLVEFDYDAFHLRLIATCINYKFDDTSIHLQLAREYFQKEDITDEEYELSKQITFKQLYGGIDPKYAHIKFFASVREFMYSLWETYNLNGYITTPITNRRLFVDDLAVHKLFNYYLQAVEFETGILVIDELNKYLHDKQSKLILYTYDSFLFDINKDDGIDVILNIRKILTNQYPVKCKAGNTYHNMRTVNFV